MNNSANSVKPVPSVHCLRTAKDSRTNYRLKAGDTVVLKENAMVNGYCFDERFAPCGTWDSHVILAGSVGHVVSPRTPWVTAPDNRTRYFANVDVSHAGGVSRIRVAHSALKRSNARAPAHA